jgi:vacuolar-type H+-ATPase subunit E/Vma4
VTLERLVAHVVEEAAAEVRRVFDRSLNESRRLVLEQEDRVHDLTQAARELGRVRGRAAEAVVAHEAEAEAAEVRRAARAALLERFLVRVRGALDDLAKDERYGDALAAFARRVAAAQEGRALDVACAPRDRQRVFAALLAAGVQDVHVVGEERVRVGLVARDLDGRTVLDATPPALVEGSRDRLAALLDVAFPV